MTTERDDLLAVLDRHRGLLRKTADGLTDEQARLRSTVSELTIGGLIKHVTAVEGRWAGFIVRGAAAMEWAGEGQAATAWADLFTMTEDETLDGLLDQYSEVAAETDDLVRTLPDLDAAHALPDRPWFEPGARWSARRVLLHVLAETSQHAGHADIVRESIDGAKSMG